MLSALTARNRIGRYTSQLPDTPSPYRNRTGGRSRELCRAFRLWVLWELRSHPLFQSLKPKPQDFLKSA